MTDSYLLDYGLSFGLGAISVYGNKKTAWWRVYCIGAAIFVMQGRQHIHFLVHCSRPRMIFLQNRT